MKDYRKNNNHQDPTNAPFRESMCVHHNHFLIQLLRDYLQNVQNLEKYVFVKLFINMHLNGKNLQRNTVLNLFQIHVMQTWVKPVMLNLCVNTDYIFKLNI